MKKQDNLEEDITEEILDLAADRRRRMGCVIEHFISLEFYLSEVLEEYFMGNRYQQKIKFRNLILGKLSFERKRQLFVKLKFEEIKKMKFDKGVHTDLTYFQKVRNALSHNLKRFDKKKKLFYVEYKINGKLETIYLDDKFVTKIEDLSVKLVGRLMKIKRVLERERFDS